MNRMADQFQKMSLNGVQYFDQEVARIQKELEEEGNKGNQWELRPWLNLCILLYKRMALKNYQF